MNNLNQLEFDKDVIRNLFNNTYTDKTKKEVLSQLEKSNTLSEVLSIYHPQYVIEGKEVMSITLAKDLGWL